MGFWEFPGCILTTLLIVALLVWMGLNRPRGFDGERGGKQIRPEAPRVGVVYSERFIAGLCHRRPNWYLQASENRVLILVHAMVMRTGRTSTTRNTEDFSYQNTGVGAY